MHDVPINGFSSILKSPGRLSKQAVKQASSQASKQASKQTSKQTSKQASMQVSSRKAFSWSHALEGLVNK